MRLPFPSSPALLRRGLPLFLLLLGATLALWAGLWLRSRRVVPIPPPPPGSQITVTFCAVGNGEAGWIKTPHGKFIVIGSGPPGSDGILVSSLRSAGAKEIALLFLPYPYAEAIGGTEGLVRAFPAVAQACEPSAAGDLPVNQWHKLARSVCREKNVPLRTIWAGQSLTVDGVEVEVLAPAKIPLAVSPSGANNSLVLRVRWRRTAFLFAGGMERAGEDALLSRTAPLQADVLRVARMGTRNAASPEFLRRVEPYFVVVSAKNSLSGNAADYPHEEALRRFAATGARVWKTGTAGQDLVFHSDGVRVGPPPGAGGETGVLLVQ